MDSRYMTEVYQVNSGCKDVDYLKLELNNQTRSYSYPNNGIDLCHFPLFQDGGYCFKCQDHNAQMRFPISDFFIESSPDFPLQIGGSYHGHPDFNITSYSFSGLSLNIDIPAPLLNNLKRGVYKIGSPSEQTPGVWMNLHWSVFDQGGPEEMETGYMMQIDKTKPHKIELVCIDKSVPSKVRLTWQFSATFAGPSFESSDTTNTYFLPLSGIMSYNMELQ